MEIYHKTAGRGAQPLLGIAPDDRGLPPEADVKRLEEFGAEVRRLFGKPLATAPASNPASIAFPGPRRVDRVVLQEDLAHGRMVRRFRVEARVGERRVDVSRGTTIGHKRILVFEPVNATAVRAEVEAAMGPARLKPIAVSDGGR
ncbi:MAG: hypothetical protein KatS3mg005_1724 [Bryobacteraceae bacterium]|nr:MAG: hypothetical protein KatS3mg005_1724 [Bryobacteraceae bacterium]